MIRLPVASLPGAAAAELDDWQTTVDGACDYPARVAEAKRLFSLRNTRRNETFRAVKQALTQMCCGVRRCVYCEDSLADEVEHIKPKDLYPEDVFRWSNYVYACGPCNGPKNNQFAVLAAGTGVLTNVSRKRKAPVVPPAAGEAALINPRQEDPMDLLVLDLVDTFTFTPRPGLDACSRARADYTISILFKHRDDLPQTHQEAYDDFLAHLRAYTRRRLAGASPAELAKLKRRILAKRNQTVWREMQRQPDSRTELRDAFDDEPDALSW